jgi:hypothetical protein
MKLHLFLRRKNNHAGHHIMLNVTQGQDHEIDVKDIVDDDNARACP